MRAFIDTSSLVKKYVEERGSEAFESLLGSVHEIIIAPTYWIELCSAVKQKAHHREMSSQQSSQLLTEAKKDLGYFSSVQWNENLVDEATRLVQKYSVKSLDSIQLASGLLSNAELFVTSDKPLYAIAKKEISAHLIG